MYTTRFVYKSGSTLQGKTVITPQRSKKITTVSCSSSVFGKDIHSPIFSSVKPASSCFVRLRQKFDAEVVRFEPGNTVPSPGVVQITTQNRRTALFTSFYLLSISAILDVKESSAAQSSLGISDSKMVGAYLPESFEEEGFYQFSADSSKTPALRAGALDRYVVSFPPRWKELPVSNAKSGNYCQPRCDEATTEVVFSDPTQGTLQIVIIPTTKLLISKKFPSMKDVGSIKNVIDAISPAITGSVAAEEEEIIGKKEFSEKGRVYYQYELLTPFAETGLHNIAKITTSQNYVIMASISASESQWSASEKDLRRVLSSFHVDEI